MWRETIQELSTSCTFYDGVTLAQLQEVEATLQLTLPEELKSLLEETNGITWQLKLTSDDVFTVPLIWSTQQIIKENLYFRDLNNTDSFLPFGILLFFGSVGNGDEVAFATAGDSVACSDVIIWKHESDNRVKLATSLRQYLTELLRND